MNDYLPLRSTLIGLAISIAILVANPAAAQKGKGKPGGGGGSPTVYYRVIPIVNSEPDSTYFVFDLSNSGEAVGYISAAEERIPFVWTAEDGLCRLQSLLSEEDAALWHLELACAINDMGQIVGFASMQGGDRNSWAAFRLNLHEEDAPFTILEEGLRNGNTTIQISNGGDIVVRREETILYYPPDFPVTEKTDLAYDGYPMGLNRHGEIIAQYGGQDVRLTPESNGGYSKLYFPIGNRLYGINDLGMIAGRRDIDNEIYSFRYTDLTGEVILKDGKRTIPGWLANSEYNSTMNDEGDIVLAGPSIHTVEGRYLKLFDLIDPVDAARFSLPKVMYARAIAARSPSSGLPPVIVCTHLGFNTLQEHFLLYPE